MPLRGGSKSIPYKNIRPIAGKPLFYWSLKSAFDSGIFAAVFVSTDDDIIARTVREYFPLARIIKRPPELATDTASTESAMMHFCGLESFDVICLIQATSPLTTAEDFSSAWQYYCAESFESMATGVMWKRFFWTPDGRPVNYDPRNRPRRQDFEGWLMENGAFYFTNREILENTQSRLAGRMGVYQMDDNTALEIDEPLDWMVVEKLLLERTAPSQLDSLVFQDKLQDIRALVVDVDSSSSDGKMHDGDSEKMRKNIRAENFQDMLKLLEILGITTCVIGEVDREKAHRFNDCDFGTKEKLSQLEERCLAWGITLQQVAYIGDDREDIECLRASGFSVCPSTADKIVRSEVDYISKCRETEGVVREVCDLIFSALRKT